ncbi:hypothetical protein Tco_1102585 [Tanacetum coccineum]
MSTRQWNRLWNWRVGKAADRRVENVYWNCLQRFCRIEMEIRSMTYAFVLWDDLLKTSIEAQRSGADLDGGVSGGAFDWCGGGSVSSGGVKTYKDEHTCLQTREVKLLTDKWLANKIEDIVKPNPNIIVKALKEQLQKKYQVGISICEVKRARAKSIMKFKGDFSEQYSSLRDYVLELQRTNEDTTMKIDIERDYNPSEITRHFKRIYYPSQLLTAVGIDANHGIYPLAYAIVEMENTSSWSWFLTCLGDDLDLNPMSNFTFISDRQKGIIPAIAQVFPCAEHRQMEKLKSLDEGSCEEGKAIGKGYDFESKD